MRGSVYMLSHIGHDSLSCHCQPSCLWTSRACYSGCKRVSTGTQEARSNQAVLKDDSIAELCCCAGGGGARGQGIPQKGAAHHAVRPSAAERVCQILCRRGRCVLHLKGFMLGLLCMGRPDLQPACIRCCVVLAEATKSSSVP